jgi:hypothetical protein
MNDVRTLEMTGVTLGVFLSVIFVVYLLLSLSESKKQRAPGGTQRLAGIISFAVGVIMTGAWVYLIAIGWNSFLTRFSTIWFHVFTEMVSSVSMLISGIAMYRNWSRGPALYMISNALLLFTTLFAFMSHGTQGHPYIMNGVSMIVLVVSVYMVALVFGWQHYVLKLDQPENAGPLDRQKQMDAAK